MVGEESRHAVPNVGLSALAFTKQLGWRSAMRLQNDFFAKSRTPTNSLVAPKREEDRNEHGKSEGVAEVIRRRSVG